MFYNAQTALLPRQKAASVDEAHTAIEPWRRQSTGDAGEGLAGERRALTTLAWVLPTILTIALGLVRSTWPGQSSTELNTWALAQRPWSETRQLVDQLDPLSAPYAVAMNLWSHAVGTGDFALRLPALLAMAGATALLAKLGAHLLSPRAGFVAGLLFAGLPTTSRYAQDIGPYALAVFLAAAATLLLVQAFDRWAVLNLLAYASVVGLLGLVSLPALALLVGHAVAVLAMRPRITAGWLAATLVGLGSAVGAWYVLRPPITLSVRGPVSWDDVIRLVPDLFGLPLVGGILVGLGLLSLSLRKPAIIFTTWALGPLVALYAATFATSFWRSEALLFTVPAWALLAAAALVRAPVVRGAMVALLAGTLSIPLHIDIRQRDGHGLGGPAIARILIENVQKNDVIVVGPGTEGRIARDVVARYVPPAQTPRDVLAVRPSRTGGQLLAAECAAVARCLGAAPRVWLLRAGATPAVLEGLPAAKDGELRTRYAAVRTWTAAGLTLTLFAVKPRTAAPAPAR